MESCLTSAVHRFLEQSVFSSAVFLAERLVAENSSESNVGLLAQAYYRSGDGHRAISLLQNGVHSPSNKYLLALCCYEAGRLAEAESALIQTKYDGKNHGNEVEDVPNGAAGLYLMGCICRRAGRIEHAIQYFTASLKEDPFLWSAYEGLCELGCEVPPEEFFGHSAREAINMQTLAKAKMQESNSKSKVELPRKTTPAKGKKAMSRTYTEKDRPTKLRQTTIHQELEETKTPSKPQYSSTCSSEQLVLKLLHDYGSAFQALSLFRCETALQLFKNLPQKQRNSGWVLHQIGRTYFEMANYTKAARIYQTIRENEPHRMSGMAVYSTILYHLKQEVNLSYLAQQVTDFDKRSSEAWFVAGNCFSLQKEHDTALTFFQRAIQLDPCFTYAYTLCGHEYAANEDFEKAIGCYRHAIRMDPRHYNAWYGMGTIYFRQEKFELAEYHFRKAIAINPQSSILYCNLGMVLHAVERNNEAIAALEHAQRLQPLNPTARFHKAKVLVAQGRYEEAHQELEFVQNAAPKESSVHFLLGKVAKKLGRIDDAMRYFNNALFFHPKDNHLIKAAIERLHEEDRDENEESLVA
ncbi:anaphase-promoting complex subunit [Thraustotheca clavata]|uniref:Anaphase-promoting complex subunit n=1 Tax=Thraustotheca clavata TaxID=74557 RepID=A0A1V9Z4S6_9STRA|nr:anaphase-promoting complex subunit [Thraustotheca clavata]